MPVSVNEKTRKRRKMPRSFFGCLLPTLLAALLFLFPTFAKAQETPEIQGDEVTPIADTDRRNAEGGEDGEYSFYPDGSTDALKRAEQLREEYSAESVLTRLAEAAKKTFFSYSGDFLSLILMTFLLGVLGVALQKERAAIVGGEICLCAAVFRLSAGLLDAVLSAMQAQSALLLSFMPPLVSLLSGSGAVLSAALSAESTVVILEVSSVLLSAVILPAYKSLLVFSALSFVSESFDFSGVFDTVRKFCAWLLGITMCVLSGTVYFQSVISAAKDGLAGRTVRYAAQSLIPIVGTVVSESARTVAESMRLVRSVTGIAGVFAVIAGAASPVLALLICKLFFSVCGALARLMGDKRCSDYFSAGSSSLDLLLGACIGLTLVSVLLLGIVAKTVTVN